MDLDSSGIDLPDDYTDPAPATAFAHLDATTNLERKLTEWVFIRSGSISVYIESIGTINCRSRTL